MSSRHSPSGSRRVEAVAAGLPEDLLGGVEAEHHSRRLLHDPCAGLRLGGDHGLAGDVAGAEVLGESARDEVA